MVCKKCGLPLGEALRESGEKHKCPKGWKKGVYTAPKAKPKPKPKPK